MSVLTTKSVIESIAFIAQKEGISIRLILGKDLGQKESAPTWELGCHENVKLCFVDESVPLS